MHRPFGHRMHFCPAKCLVSLDWTIYLPCCLTSYTCRSCVHNQALFWGQALQFTPHTSLCSPQHELRLWCVGGRQWMEESTLTGRASKSELSSPATESQALTEPGCTSPGSTEKPLKPFHAKQDFLKTQDSQHSGSACTSPWTCSDFPAPALNPTCGLLP